MVEVVVEEFEMVDSLDQLLVGNLGHLLMDWNNLQGMAVDDCMQHLMNGFLVVGVNLEAVLKGKLSLTLQ
jgi:hypothetical protein